MIVIVTVKDTKEAHSGCSTVRLSITEAACGIRRDPTRMMPTVTLTMVKTVVLTSIFVHPLYSINTFFVVKSRYSINIITNFVIRERTRDKMAKQMIIIDGKVAKSYRLGKNNRPMTTVKHRLFRTDDELFFKQQDSEDSIIIYHLDSTQPYTDNEDNYLDPDKTMALIDIGRATYGKNMGFVDKITGMDGMKWVYIAVAFIIVLGALGLI